MVSSVLSVLVNTHEVYLLHRRSVTYDLNS